MGNGTSIGQQGWISTGGDKMKFRLKITLCMLCLLSLLFGIGGSVLISISFHTSLEREKEAAHENYQMLLNTLQVVNTLDKWSNVDDISNALSQLLSQNTSSWSALRLSTKTEMIFNNGFSNKLKNINQQDITTKYCQISAISGEDGEQYLQLSGAFVMGDEMLYLEALRNVTSVYDMRIEQQKAYRMVYVFMVIICTLLTYSISWLLTRPLVRLSRASKEIARGNLSCRSNIKTSDEVGALSIEFDNMASQMEKSVKDLQNAMERQERFTRSFTHELKTPMASIIGYADLIRCQTLTIDEQAEAANYIFGAGKRLEKLSVHLLDIFVAEKQEIVFRKTTLSTLIEKVVDSQQKINSDKKIKISTDCQSGSCCLEPDLVWSLLTNLIDNAQKALDEGGKIEIFSEIINGGCQIRIVDNGRGIASESLEHITEAFYRADITRSRKEGGAGLGLTLCAKIVELHNGTMTFDSEPGKGTCVMIKLKGGSV